MESRMFSPPASVPGSSHNLAVQSIDNLSLMVGVTSNQEPNLPGSRSPAVRSADDLPTTVGSITIQQHFEIDMLIRVGQLQVWDASNGVKLTDLVGREAPFILSASVDGQVKVWLYDVTGPRIEYNAPCRGCVSMAYSSNGRRLFACGTSKEGETVMAEWNEVDGGLRRTYQGMHKNVTNAVHFDLSKNRYLVTGDNHHIKYWDIDDENILLITDPEGGLPANPCIRFNKDGSLLTVSTDDSRVKILANINGQ
ncbi:hypothetical protein Ancab_001858 [Ancistrocladus abbreviatus]